MAVAAVAGVLVTAAGVYFSVADSRNLWPFAPPSGDQPPAAVCTGLSIELSPSRGAVGTQVEVTGCGFGPGEDVTITVEGREAASARTDATGGFTRPITILSEFVGATGGDLTVIAAGRASLTQASAPFTVSID